MRAASVIAMATCACGSRAAAPKAPAPPSTTTTTAASAPALIDATPRHYALLLTGMVPSPSRRTTFELVVDGGHASLRVTQAHATQHPVVLDGTDAHATWVSDGSLQFAGTATSSAGALELDITADRKPRAPLHLRCATRSVTAVAADAHFGPHVPRPRAFADCGDPGVWTPAATASVVVLACVGFGELGPAAQGAPDELLFGAGPGVEWAYTNNDCVVQGGGLRIAR